MSDPKAPRSRMLLWLAVLLLGAVGVVTAAVPLLDCPACNGSGSLAQVTDSSKREVQGVKTYSCPDCKAGKVTVLGRLLR